MDSSDLERLLQPLSEEAPCGPDLEYDNEFGEMERTAQGTSEQQYGDTVVAAEPPDWKDLQKRALALLERTKDMRVCVYLARSALHMDGLVGFRFATELLKGYVETFWETVHPELDRSDNDDPTYRINTLTTLCDEATVLRELQAAPVVSSRALGRFSLRDIEQAAEASGAAEPEPVAEGQGAWADSEGADEPEKSGPTEATIEAAFTDSEIDELQETEEASRIAAESIATIEQIVTEQVGAAQAVSLAPVRNLLLQINGHLVSHLERRGVYADASPESEEVGGGEEAAEGSEEGTGGAVASATTIQLNGNIATRQDAIKALDRVCEYYEQNEPSSPLPLLIRRAQRLASKSFLEILRDLAPDAVSQAEALGGGGGGGYVAETEQSEEESDSSSTW